MIGKKFRVPRASFSKKAENRVFSAHFQGIAFSNECGHNRFAAVIGLKADKRSTGRHFWKRFILDHLKKKPNSGKDFIIYAKQELENVEKEKVKKELDEMFAKLSNQS